MELKIKKRFSLVIILIQTFVVCSQEPPDEFFKGLDLFEIDKKQAKKEFLIALNRDSLFHGTYHFLGIIYSDENKIDSAIFCFKKSIALNKENINHTREMAYVRLINTYLYQHDFSNSFSVAWEAYRLYPENNVIYQELKDICLWSFYTKHNNLDLSYLSPELKDEYIVTSVPEEYLIMRKIRVNDQYLVFNNQSLVKKRKAYYDILNCSLSSNNATLDIKFRLNWDLDKEFGGRGSNINIVYSNSDNPIYERIGALLVSDSDIDLKKEIETLEKNK